MGINKCYTGNHVICTLMAARAGANAASRENHLPISRDSMLSLFADARQDTYVSSVTLSEKATGRLLEQLPDISRLIGAGKELT